jgi:branched-chain amino acid transport system substrate-binding protein
MDTSSHGIPRKIDHYDIVRLIGEGGMAYVYQARDPQLKRDVAIKVLKPKFGNIAEFQERFQREAHALAVLDNHPHILSIHNYREYGEADLGEGSRAYLVTSYLSGGSLEEKLQSQPLPSIQEALHIIIQLLDALDYAHGKRFLHRDIKPGNILFTKDSSLVLSDFGLVKLLEESQGSNQEGITQHGQIIGTPIYMAPELFQEQKATPQSDLYSVGVVLYRMLTGNYQYKQLLSSTPLAIRDTNRTVSLELEQVVLKALDKDPRRRYQSAGEFREALRSIQYKLADSTVLLIPPTQPISRPREAVDSMSTVLPGRTNLYQSTQMEPGGGIRGQVSKPSGPSKPLLYMTGVVLLVIVLIAAGIYLTSGRATSSSAGTPPPIVASQHIIKIAIDMPLEGIDGSDGLPIKEGAEFAISQANQQHMIPGYTIVPVQYDDTGPSGTPDPNQGVKNVTTAINDGLTAAIIGPYNSAVAEEEMPITNAASIAQISPANTDPCLTKSTLEICSGSNNLLSRVRPTGNVTYFRLASTDDLQVKVLASFLKKKSYQTAYIIYSQGDPYSDTFARLFLQAWEHVGGTIVAPMDNEPSDAPVSQYVGQFQQLPTTPDFVFFAGTMPAAANVKDAMAEVPRLNATAYVGGAGLVLDSFVQAIRSGGGPVFAAVPIVDDSQTQQFRTNYLNAPHNVSDYRPYTASANDCALIIIQAIKMVIAQNILPPKNSQDKQEAIKFRRAIIQAIKGITVHDIPATNNLFIATSFQSFDKNGDNTSNYISVYSLDASNTNDPWQLQESDPVS